MCIFLILFLYCNNHCVLDIYVLPDTCVYYYYYLLYKNAFQLFCSDNKTEQLDTVIGLPRKESISL